MILWRFLDIGDIWVIGDIGDIGILRGYWGHWGYWRYWVHLFTCEYVRVYLITSDYIVKICGYI